MPAVPLPQPGDARHDLLRVLLLPDPVAAAGAWQIWRARHDFERLPPGSYRLMPILARRLVALGIEDPLLPRLRGIHRQTLVRNLILRKHALGVVAALGAHGIPTLLLKGIALSAAHYRDWGARYCRDVDVLVPAALRDRARRILADADGWGCATQVDPRVTHGESWMRGGRSLDLHWRPLWEATHDGWGEDALWARARTAEWDGCVVAYPSAADLLFQACAHATRAGSIRNRNESLRLMDVAVIARDEGPALDWATVTGLAESHHLRLRVHDVLAYLHDTFEVPVPAEARAALAAPYRRVERMEAAALARPDFRPFTDEEFWHRFHRTFPDGRVGPLRALGFPAFLARRRGISSGRSLVKVAKVVKRAVRRRARGVALRLRRWLGGTPRAAASG